MTIIEFLNLVKLPTKYIIAIGLAINAMLFLPDSVLVNFGIDTFVKDNKTVIGIIDLFIISVLIIQFFYWIFGKINKKRIEKQDSENLYAALKNLSPQEKLILSGYIINKTKSRKLSITDGVANGLEDLKILYKSSSMGNLSGFVFNMQPWAWEELNKSVSFLEPEYSILKNRE